MSENMEKETSCACSCGTLRNRVIGVVLFLAAVAVGAGLLTSGALAGDGAEGKGSCSAIKAVCPVSSCGEKAEAGSSEEDAAAKGCCPGDEAKAGSSEEESAPKGCCPKDKAACADKAKAGSSEEETAPKGCCPKDKAACADKGKECCPKVKAACADKAKAGSSEEEAACQKTNKRGSCSRGASSCVTKNVPTSAT
ncbi:MAG TPA: hypothetical protein PKI11_16310 [Candidatus Hydrogenedentes bacterium]|nr:hypothetical protein [Candidatus Hydrogenedentota bacterium]